MSDEAASFHFNAPISDEAIGRMQRRACEAATRFDATPLNYDDLAETVPAPRTRAPFWLRWLGWLGIGSALVLATACGGAPGAFRSTIAATAEAVNEADEQVAPVYGREADRCLASSPTMAVYRECMGTQDALASALETAAAALSTAESALDAWDDQATEGAQWHEWIPCVSKALYFLRTALEAAGLEMPEAIKTGLEFAATFGGQCTEAE